MCCAASIFQTSDKVNSCFIDIMITEYFHIKIPRFLKIYHFNQQVVCPVIPHNDLPTSDEESIF